MTLIQKYLPWLHVTTDWEEHKKVSKQTDACVLVLHHQLFTRLINRLVRRTWSFIFIDESQVMKARASKMSRAAARLRDKSEYKLILSGTPIDDEPQDLWGQFRFLRPQVLGDKWSNFEDRFLLRTGYMGYKRKFRADRRREFVSLVASWSLRLTKRDLSIIEPRVILAPTSLSVIQRRRYDRLERKGVVEIHGKTVSGDMTITLMAKLHQVCGGWVYDDDGEIVRTGASKLDRLIGLVEKSEGPYVVFCRYKQEIDFIAKIFRNDGMRVAVLRGNVKDRKVKKHRSKIIEDFQAGLYDMIVAQEKTGGVGVDLYEGQTSFIYSTTWSWIDFDQALARLVHLTKEIEPVVYVIFAKDTIDEDIVKAIRGKKNFTQKLYRRIRRVSKKLR